MNPQSEENKVLEKKKKKKKANHKTKSHVKGPKPKAPYLVLPLELGSEDRHAIQAIRWSSFMPLLDLGRHETSLTTEDLGLR